MGGEKNSLTKKQDYTATDSFQDQYPTLKPVYMKTIKRESLAVNNRSRIAIPKSLVSAWNARDVSALYRFSVHRCPTRWIFSGTGLELVTKPGIPIPLGYRGPWNARKRLLWCRDHLNWTQLQLKQVMWSGESSFTLFQTTGPVFFWRTLTEAFHVDFLVPAMKHGEGFVIVWGACIGISRCFEGYDHKQQLSIILVDHFFTLCFRLSSRKNVQDNNALISRLTVFKHG
ncbi:transposable element Tcb1 transposase [Trichonephila clavipes]|nr:transposable element Tcb1 transposase [Trichonephila clavipes]